LTQNIRDVLNRRTDLSTFVVHLTRDTEEQGARQALDSIISERFLRAKTPMGWARDQDDSSDMGSQSQRVVCFSETPLEHIYSLVADIWGRQIQLAPYGVAMTKMVARRRGINPIWYIDTTQGRDWLLARALDALRDEAISTGDFHNQPVATLTPFCEQMGTWPTVGGQKEFWWEREWRHAGNVYLPAGGVIWLCPEDEIPDLGVGPNAAVIDPQWGLEQIIAHLAGFAPRDVTPFQ
jgi:hypothetical protein